METLQSFLRDFYYLMETLPHFSRNFLSFMHSFFSFATVISVIAMLLDILILSDDKSMKKSITEEYSIGRGLYIFFWWQGVLIISSSTGIGPRPCTQLL